jgi:integrase
VNNKLSFWTDYFELKNGRIKIFKRKGVSSRYYARLTFRGTKGFVQESLFTTDKEEATEAALEKWLQYEFKLKQGLSLTKKTFKDVSTEYLGYLAEKVARGEIKQRKLHGQKLMIDRYFDNFFGDMQLADIQNKELERYREWRKNYWISGEGSKQRHITYYRNGKKIKREIHESQRTRVAASTTVNSEETILRAIFKFAVTKGYIASNEVVQIKTERVKFNQRSTFSEGEYRKLLVVGRKRIEELKDSGRDRELWYRTLLYNYILIASNCGCRTTELMNLRWKDIEWDAKDASGGSNIILSVSGKAKSRELVANDVCRDYLTRILEQQRGFSEKYGFQFKAHDEFVFSDCRGRKIQSMKGNFNALLDEAGLTRDKAGKKRSLSSLRIFYCTMRLLKGDNVDLYNLALNMGSSVKMLQKTYSRLTARLKAHRIKATAARIERATALNKTT